MEFRHADQARIRERRSDIAVLRGQLSNGVDFDRQRKREVKGAAPDEFEHFLVPAMAVEAPGKKARFGHHRVAGEQREVDQAPLGAHPIMMRIRCIEERDQGPCVENDPAAH